MNSREAEKRSVERARRRGAVNPQMGEPRGNEHRVRIECRSRPPEETLAPSVLAHANDPAKSQIRGRDPISSTSSPLQGAITRGAPHVPHRNRPTECQKEHCPGKGELITPELRKKRCAHHTEPLMSHSDSNDASAGGKKFLSLLDEHPKGQPAPPSAPPSPPDSEAEDTAEESSPTPQYDPPHRAAVVPTSHSSQPSNKGSEVRDVTTQVRKMVPEDLIFVA